jgi:heme exporter protein D
MDIDIIIGIVLTTTALAVLLVLTFWSRRIINSIARTGCRTARQTLKELTNGK